MTINIECLYMYYWENVYTIFCPFLNWSVGLIIEFKGSLYILDTRRTVYLLFGGTKGP